MAKHLLTVDVTEDDIKKGQRGRSAYCPIALALARKVPKKYTVLAGTTIFFFTWWGKCRRVRPPEAAMNFTHDFDHNIPVKPLSFKLEI